MALCLPVKDATLVLTRPARAGIEPIARKAILGADGYWHVENVQRRPPDAGMCGSML